ncbi:thioester domain-containing protein [Actinophytocola xanthii]|uniref:Thioester domain-containing protein n=1 Tax=Actinophytocola xanthii TaxID=1912961 RepID=A0A1Q8CRQ8_9PSEU|nr:thioester domain-containing protein [Actinophytocola xanthii]OLF17052.1 hypothetical protein BU204_13220 [Actinophytocola xanthii]
MPSRFQAARARVGALGAAVAVVATMTGGTLSASAEPASGMVAGETLGYHVNMGRGKLKDIITKVIGLQLSDGSKLGMYCVAIRTGLDPKQELVETPWAEFPEPGSAFNTNRDRINWILHNGFPATPRKQLAQTLRDRGVTLHGGLNPEEAITGTQAAIWHFSDGVEINRKNPLPVVGKKFDADVLALYDYLTGEDNVGIGDQPAPALEVAPEELSGEAGERIGPLTVSTTGEVTDLAAELPEGVRITDAEGDELGAEDIVDGTELYLDVPEDAAAGEVTVELAATAQVRTGRLFVSRNYAQKKSQPVIVAQVASTELSASATVTWTAAPPPSSTTSPPSSTTTPPSSTTAPTSSSTTTSATTTTSAAPVPQGRNDGGLATTGASVLAPVVIGLVLVGAGAGALLFLRRRRNA